MFSANAPFSVLLTILLAQHVILVQSVQYGLIKEYSGSTFFDEWDYFDAPDAPTSGDVIFVSEAVGKSSMLTYVDPQSNRAIMRVDNTSVVPFNEKRNAVRITTKESYAVGSVWIADMYHVPFGCSVWPSWWSFSTSTVWPTGGEIDVFEGINLSPTSQMGLHTNPGCSQVAPKQTSTLINSTDCAGAENQGCITTNSDTTSYGPAFAAAGGGVFVTEYAESGISNWFFSRPNVPSGLLTSTTVDTSQLGMPMGNWPAGGCDVNQFFLPQSLVFTITLCGVFAGNPQFFNQTCQGVCYLDYVVGNGSSYGNAYFEVGSVRVFNTNSTGQISSSASGSSSGSSPSSTSSKSNATFANTVPRIGRSFILALVLALAEFLI
ncbi:glycoside hydrolase family 16 protein [Crucibulum laeve]|uniref:Glycoside hydrolase family 16 protein n=1 Tax=Crucibulum laeve TaxID=68775 RepID=A0A5C3MHQ7_9AGAR|nr:glycoside hydrolase family 16 protein [Crucibulum laeve]